MQTVAEFNWEWMYNPILWNVFVIWEDWNDYVIITKKKMDKNTIYPSKEFYLNNINNGNKRNNWEDR